MDTYSKLLCDWLVHKTAIKSNYSLYIPQAQGLMWTLKAHVSISWTIMKEKKPQNVACGEMQTGARHVDFLMCCLSKGLTGMPLMWNMLHLPRSQVFHSALGEPCRITPWDHTAFSVWLHIFSPWRSSTALHCPSGYPASPRKVHFGQTWQTSSTRLD